jgi:peptide/nickel transport system ATP-binding protein
LSQVRVEEPLPQSEQNALIQVRNLSVVFEKQRGIIRREKLLIRAVDNVSLELRESEFVSIVGETGSGKSTLAKCIVRLQEPTIGSIIYEERDIAHLKSSQLKTYRRDVQMIFQDPFESLLPRQDVFSTISTPIRNLRGEKSHDRLYDATSHLLEEVGLEPEVVMHRLPHQLSGGQRQRVSIARALASDPRVLIADEPITMLDAAQRLNVLSLLMDLRSKRKLTVMMITHDISSAKITSDRILVMYFGKVVEMGKASSIVSSYHHPYVELILSSHSRMRSTAPVDTGGKLGEIGEARPLEGCVFEPRCKYATDVCKKTEPPFSELSPSHYASCHNPLNVGKRPTS